MAVDRLPGLQSVDVEPQDTGDDSEQRRRIKAKVSCTFGLRQDITQQEAVQKSVQLGPKRLRYRGALQSEAHLILSE